MKYAILQLDTDNPNVLKDHKLFESWDMLNKTTGFNIHQYKKVYEGEVDDQGSLHNTLGYLFKKFNLYHPEDFRGHSLSVSDIINLDGVDYYCDSYTWVNIKEDKSI